MFMLYLQVALCYEPGFLNSPGFLNFPGFLNSSGFPIECLKMSLNFKTKIQGLKSQIRLSCSKVLYLGTLFSPYSKFPDTVYGRETYLNLKTKIQGLESA